MYWYQNQSVLSISSKKKKKKNDKGAFITKRSPWMKTYIFKSDNVIEIYVYIYTYEKNWRTKSEPKLEFNAGKCLPRKQKPAVKNRYCKLELFFFLPISKSAFMDTRPGRARTVVLER